MKHCLVIACTTAILIHAASTNLCARSGPFDGKAFQGRIAFSSDGNFNDEDDWGAFPVAVAILDAFGATDRLVHVDYNNILQSNDPRFHKEMTASVLGAAERYKIRPSILFDCQKDLDGAVESIRSAINASAPDDPLYFVLAGPMEVPLRGIEKSDPARRKYVYCISHSVWNDGYTRTDQALHTRNKRDVIPSGIHWIQVKDGNRNLAHPGGVARESAPAQWRLYEWLRDSRDARLRWIFTRLEAEQRCDISDATMTYFLLTGDEEADLAKLKSLLDDKEIPAPIQPRKEVRIEAENFRDFENYQVDFRNDRDASHRAGVRLSKSGPGRIRTPLDQPYTAASGRYNVDVRYFDDGRGEYRLSVNGKQQGDGWRAAGGGQGWMTKALSDIFVSTGDELMVEVRGGGGAGGRLDYLQLNLKAAGADPAAPAGISPASFSATGPLDDPKALPGQVIVAGARPGCLKYNGGGPVFLSGPDNPEEFLFLGDLQPDGTRSGGPQIEMIERMARAGVNAFHCQMTRMKRCNYKNEGDDTHTPFISHDPAKGLNEAVLGQWDKWLDLFEQKGIIVQLEFYNDATDVERTGWKLDADGNLPPDEKRWIEGIVKRFKHHRNIMWGIEESCNKLPGARTPHFKKIGEAIARADDHNHPIVQSFVVPNDPEKDFPEGGILSDDYVGDPNIRVVTWLHVVPHGEDIEQQHQEYLKYARLDGKRFVVLKNETFHHPRGGALSRRYMWSCALAGLHTLEAYHHADGKRTDENTLRDDGRIKTFMEQTDFHTMTPRDDLAAGSTKWLLANPGDSYIAYTYDYTGPMGAHDMIAGTYDLLWFDPVDGDTVKRTGVSIASGSALWSKPDSLGNEIALYIKRRAGL